LYVLIAEISSMEIGKDITIVKHAVKLATSSLFDLNDRRK
jgi:hypothetical protein